MDLLVFAGILAIAYFLGGIPFGWLVAKSLGVTDIRTHGSGNIGATNVWRTLGPKAAGWVYAGDIGKGVLAVLLARSVHQNIIPSDYFLVLTALLAVTGHVFSIYLAFRGGKGVNTALGVMITLLPWHTLIALAAFLLTVALSKYIALGSIVAASSLFLATLIEKLAFFPDRPVIYTALTAAIMLLVVYTHRTNLSRVVARTENKFSFSGGKGAK